MNTQTALDLSHHLDQLLASERGVMVEFIVALAEFDRRKLYVELGHRSLFDYLTRALRLSESSAYYRKTAAELVRRFPAVVTPLRDGSLCITNLVKLRDVLNEQNCEAVLAGALGKPKREVEALVAACAPVPARRDVICAIPVIPTAPTMLPIGFEKTSSASSSPTELMPTAQEFTVSAVAPIRPDATEPLSSKLHRLHITVTSEFMRDLEAAKAALSHCHSTSGSRSLETIFREGLRLILKEHRKRKALTDRPRATRASSASASAQTSRAQTSRAQTSPVRPSNDRYIPAAIRRAVWIRDQGCCQWPLAEGGVCASKNQVQYHHLVEHARGGQATVENLQLVCRTHNLLAAEKSYGADFMRPFRRRSRTTSALQAIEVPPVDVIG